MVELAAGWNDVGAWDVAWQASNKDPQVNVTSGDVILSDIKNTLVKASSRLVSLVGLDNVIVIETTDAVLVADRSKS
jgi:mannose-1-phosphate guanylyltransferase/mannose-6-phosphate isomerase